MKNKKNIGRAVLLACLFATSLSSCSIFKNKKEENFLDKSSKKSQQIIYEAKKTSIKKDKTTEVLVDAEIKKDDIVKVVKHGDHWHVFTKDGREKITYSDPNQIKDNSNFEMVSVVGKSQLKNKNVVAIKKHGDHYHVYLADGSEYLTYEDPSALFPNIKIGTYVGSHGQQKAGKSKSQRLAENKKVKEKLEKDDERVIKILKHGDHYHIYTSKGNEFVTYEDPRSLYPNASYGLYEGKHGDRKNMIAQILKEDKENQAKKKAAGIKDEKENSDKLKEADKLVKVEENKKTHNVVSILKHGDHWHVYTADGGEYITYSDPSYSYPDVAVGTYHGSHGGEKEKSTKEKEKNQKEEVSSEDKPIYPTEDRKTRIEKLNITGILGQKDVNRYDIVKILQHEDHYHIYDSEGREGVTYENPKDLYPNAYFGQYKGSHSDKDKNKDEINWPDGITKIVDHGSHWHLYIGDKEVGVVNENPKPHYPNAEYIDQSRDYSRVEVGKGDLFTYESVEPKKIPGIEKIFDKRFNEMNKFGQIKDGKPAYGPGGQYKGGKVFYWLHQGDHYHYLSIEDLVKMQKAGELGEFTAKDIVATLKYKMKNPGEKIVDDYDDQKSEILRSNILQMLQKEYPDADVQNIELKFYIYGSDDFTFHISDFEEKDGKIVYKKGKLPEMKKKESEEESPKENEEEKPSKENPNDKTDEKSLDEGKEKNDGKENSEKDEKNLGKEGQKEKEKEDQSADKENQNNNYSGYASKEEAENAAKKDLENNPEKNLYDLFQGANGRWYYSLK